MTKKFKKYTSIRGDMRGFNPHQIKYIYERDGGSCIYCGLPATEIDHVISWKDGGQTIISNGVSCCRKCNRYKREHSDDIDMLTRAIFWLMRCGEDVSWIDKYLDR